MQPFRLLAHNGEINTLWGNRNAMRAREPALASPVWGDAVQRLKPVIWAEGSDSANLDNALELLVRSGRDPVHAVMMLVPEAHEAGAEMDPAIARLLRIPRVPDRALGRTGGAGVQRRVHGRRGARS